jgi:hypothetical protein
MSALLTGADAHDDGGDDDDGSEAGSSDAADVSSDEDDVSRDDDVDESAFEKNDDSDAFDDDVDAVLRSVRVPCSVRDGSRRVKREKGGSKNQTNAEVRAVGGDGAFDGRRRRVSKSRADAGDDVPV